MGLNSIKLFCIPYSGGNAYSYSEFKKFLPENIELCNLELPGRGKRILEPLLGSIEEMTEDLFLQIKNKIDGKYVIFGHSLGALLSLTLCRYIAKKRLNLPVTLFVSGQAAASLIKPDDTFALPDDLFLNMLRKMEGTPEELLADESFVKYFLPVIRADFKSISCYKYEPSDVSIKTPIAVLLGTKENISDEDALAWQKETDMSISINRFEGGHFFIFNNTSEICRHIVDKINGAN